MNETTQTGNGRPADDDDYQVQIARALRRALRRVADYAMLHDDAAAAANEALLLLRAEFLYRFELLRSSKRQPVLIVPHPIPPATSCELAD